MVAPNWVLVQREEGEDALSWGREIDALAISAELERARQRHTNLRALWTEHDSGPLPHIGTVPTREHYRHSKMLVFCHVLVALSVIGAT